MTTKKTEKKLLDVDENDKVIVSYILNEYDRKDNLIGLNVYNEISKQLNIDINQHSPIFNDIENYIVAKFYEMEDEIFNNERYKIIKK